MEASACGAWASSLSVYRWIRRIFNPHWLNLHCLWCWPSEKLRAAEGTSLQDNRLILIENVVSRGGAIVELDTQEKRPTWLSPVGRSLSSSKVDQ